MKPIKTSDLDEFVGEYCRWALQSVFKTLELIHRMLLFVSYPLIIPGFVFGGNKSGKGFHLAYYGYPRLCPWVTVGIGNQGGCKFVLVCCEV